MKFFSRSSRATGPKMRVPRGLRCVVDDHGRVLVERDQRAVVAAERLLRPDDDRLHDLALLDRALRRGGLDRRGDDVADPRVAAAASRRRRGCRGARGRPCCRPPSGVSPAGSSARTPSPRSRRAASASSSRAGASRRCGRCRRSPAAFASSCAWNLRVRRTTFLYLRVRLRHVDLDDDRLVALVGDDDAAPLLAPAELGLRLRQARDRLARRRGARASASSACGGARAGARFAGFARLGLGGCGARRLLGGGLGAASSAAASSARPRRRLLDAPRRLRPPRRPAPRRNLLGSGVLGLGFDGGSSALRLGSGSRPASSAATSRQRPPRSPPRRRPPRPRPLSPPATTSSTALRGRRLGRGSSLGVARPRGSTALGSSSRSASSRLPSSSRPSPLRFARAAPSGCGRSRAARAAAGCVFSSAPVADWKRRLKSSLRVSARRSVELVVAQVAQLLSPQRDHRPRGARTSS